MSREDHQEDSPGDIAERIENSGWYSSLAKIGVAVINLAFLLAVIVLLPQNLNSASNAIDSILMPLIFVGIAFLLLGIAMHLHLLHLNLIRQIQRMD
ncbi:hypothetical protein [Halostella sp. PRR32]|uniref:hypothetical protein n=1 Tax=Halostella sp. PRR32 TaxID=3098147 RepID=UPI002B1E82A0|nr:hypothetical protein [Halostella sp. PRR32]